MFLYVTAYPGAGLQIKDCNYKPVHKKNNIQKAHLLLQLN